jgi:hypothetical protein
MLWLSLDFIGLAYCLGTCVGSRVFGSALERYLIQHGEQCPVCHAAIKHFAEHERAARVP